MTSDLDYIKPMIVGERINPALGAGDAAPVTLGELFLLDNVVCGDERPRDGASRVLDRALDERVTNVVLLGTVARDAFNLRSILPRDWYTWPTGPKTHVRVAWIWHPSGMNREYNDPQAVTNVSAFLWTIATDARRTLHLRP